MGGRALETLPALFWPTLANFHFSQWSPDLQFCVTTPLRLGPKKIMACVTKSKTLVRCFVPFTKCCTVQTVSNFPQRHQMWASYHKMWNSTLYAYIWGISEFPRFSQDLNFLDWKIQVKFLWDSSIICQIWVHTPHFMFVHSRLWQRNDLERNFVFFSFFVKTPRCLWGIKLQWRCAKPEDHF